MKNIIIVIILSILIIGNLSAQDSSKINKFKLDCEEMFISILKIHSTRSDEYENELFHNILFRESADHEESKFKLLVLLDQSLDADAADSIDMRDNIKFRLKHFILLSLVSNINGIAKDSYLDLAESYLICSVDINLYFDKFDELLLIETIRLLIELKSINYEITENNINRYIKAVDDICANYKSEYSQNYDDYLEIKNLLVQD